MARRIDGKELGPASLVEEIGLLYDHLKLKYSIGFKLILFGGAGV